MRFCPTGHSPLTSGHQCFGFSRYILYRLVHPENYNFVLGTILSLNQSFCFYYVQTYFFDESIQLMFHLNFKLYSLPIGCLYRYTSISHPSTSLIFDKEVAGTGLFLVVLYPISRIPSFNKSDIFRRDFELPYPCKAFHAPEQSAF